MNVIIVCVINVVCPVIPDKRVGEASAAVETLSSRPSAEKMSVGGESIPSSEFETVSLFEDTG